MKFRVEKVAIEDIDSMIEVIHSVWQQIQQKDWFVVDSAEHVYGILSTGKGLGFQALEEETGRLAGVFLTEFPGREDGSLGRDIGLADEELNLVAHMDTVAILPEYRGNHLQYQLMQTAEVYLQQMGYHYLMCTVHPDNVYSKGNMKKQGYEVVKTTVKYGGYQRDILLKQI